jgi:NAD(P)-dependent dehydrogenase (short-subunit alcohol dehydrogenase family)
MKFTDKTILITGGSGGMGETMARRFGRSGARVVICDLGADAVEAAASKLADEGIDALGLAADVTKEDSMAAAIESALARYGTLDGLVTAAGIRQTAQGFLDLDYERWKLIQDVNVNGTFISIRAAAPALIASTGAIVTVSSVTALAARMNQSAYCTSKAAVLHLTKQIALELSPHRVRVNALCPGVTSTPMIEQAIRTDGPTLLRDKVEGNLKDFRPGIPLGRLAEPEEQAAAAEFLLSSDASFITGSALFVDGGVSMLG